MKNYDKVFSSETLWAIFDYTILQSQFAFTGDHQILKLEHIDGGLSKLSDSVFFAKLTEMDRSWAQCSMREQTRRDSTNYF